MHLSTSLRFDRQGRTAAANDRQHIRDLIEQILFTSPGERVNRPDFGSGLLQAMFEPNSSEMAATVQFLAQSSLNQWLGHLIEVGAVEIVQEDSRLEVKVAYTVLRDQETEIAQFTR